MQDDKEIKEVVANPDENIEEVIPDENDIDNKVILDDEESVNIVVNETIDETIGTKEEKKKISRKEKKINKMRLKLLDSMDIKYRGPLSYRHLRIIAWIAMAITQFLLINNISGSLFGQPMVSGPGYYVLSILSDLAVPLFFIATFSTILNKSKSYKKILILYTALYFSIALGVIIIFRRYLYGFFGTMASESPITTDASLYAGETIGPKLNFNVFSDLLMLSLFNFFIVYKPTKYFQGNKRIIFRLFSIIPLVVASISYLLKTLQSFGKIMLPFEMYPFLTTKPPLVYLIFILLTLWMKRREKWFIKLGASQDDYEKYQKSNKNSLSFAKALSLFLAIASVLDFVAVIVIGVFAYLKGLDPMGSALAMQFGQCAGLFVAIPFVLLFSYTKSYEAGGNTDLLIPLAGIGLIVLTYVEAYIK